MTALLDTSFLFALTDRSDRNHQRVLPVVVLPEICYLVASRLGHQAMRHFVASMTPDAVQLESVTLKDLVRVHEILEKYADNHLDFTDAAKTILIDKIEASMIGQIDRDILLEGVKKAQERIAEIVGEASLQENHGEVQTIPGDIALAQIRQLLGK